MKKRLDWLDIAKGIGILLVIFGHCLNISGKLFHLIFTFHMPFFLILSGYVFTGRESFSDLIKKKVKTLLVPFAGFFLLGLVVTVILPEWRQGLTLAGIKTDLWMADPNAVHNSSIWYLVCLFFVVLLFYYIRKLPAALQFLSLLILYTAGIWYSKNRFPFMGYGRLPLNLDVLPVAIVFFALGYYAKLTGTMQLLTEKTSCALAATVVGTLGTCIVYKYNGYVNLHGLNFGSPDLYLLGGVLGTVALVGFSVVMSKASIPGINYLKEIFIWYGKHSLNILGLQSLLIRLYIVGMDRLFGIQLGLYCFSIKHSIVSTVLVAFIACPVLCRIMDEVKIIGTHSKKEMVS